MLRGAYDAKTLMQFAAVRGKATILPEETAGSMVSLGCDRATAEALLQQVSGYAVVANINHPQQTVVRDTVVLNRSPTRPQNRDIYAASSN